MIQIQKCPKFKNVPNSKMSQIKKMSKILICSSYQTVLVDQPHIFTFKWFQLIDQPNFELFKWRTNPIFHLLNGCQPHI